MFMTGEKEEKRLYFVTLFHVVYIPHAKYRALVNVCEISGVLDAGNSSVIRDNTSRCSGITTERLLCTYAGATATLSCARASFCFEYKTKLSVDPPTCRVCSFPDVRPYPPIQRMHLIFSYT